MKFPIAATALFLATASAFAPQSAFVNNNKNVMSVSKLWSATQTS